jgi:putative transposase
MRERNPESFAFPAGASPVSDLLTAKLREGAQKMLASAIEEEVAEYLATRSQLRDHAGRQQVVRNGHLPTREILTGVGAVAVTQPRVRDRREPGQREKFTSKLLPPYLRKAKNIEELIPWLYLKGISTGDMGEALQALVGPEAAGLSATTVGRLKEVWEGEFKAWKRRSLEDQKYVYLWADGVHFNLRLEEDRLCVLVLMGATADGTKELIAVSDGYRESEQSWSALLLDVKHRGLNVDPKLATGDGALGFWAALRKVFPRTRAQRCWVHKSANVLDQLPKRLQPEALDKLHQIWMAPTKQESNRAFDLFGKTYGAKYPAAVARLAKDRDVLLTFYDFPAEHWMHLRTTNPIESTFATVRLRHDKTRNNGSRTACLTMVFKLLENAAKTWRKLNGSNLLPAVIAGVIYEDGIQKTAA